MAIFKEIWAYFKSQKKWLVAFMLFFMTALGILLVMTQSSSVAPFIYALF